jgi:hypothetical protein
MPRISELTLDQVNRKIDILDQVQNQVADIQAKADFAAQQVVIADPIHAASTTNSLNMTWTGSTGVLSWPLGFIKDKNWNAQTTVRPVIKSSAPGQQHVYQIAPGSMTVQPNTYYWVGWDPTHQTMVIEKDASIIHGNYNVHLLCQIYTGTAGQSGVAGGGGSNGGVDLSGLRYKNF